jgi:3-oxoadipate enol-lactonase
VASTYLNWFPAFTALSGRFRVVATDLRGHGRGIPVSVRRPFRLSDCADDAALVASSLGIEQFIPVGYSLGGPVAQLLWRRHRSQVAGLVLCATARDFMGTPQERMFFQSMYGFSTAVRLTRFVPGLGRVGEQPPPPEQMEGGRLTAFALEELRRTSPGAVLGAMTALGRFSSRDWIGDIDVPAAVVITTRDRAISPGRQHRLAKVIPGATVHLAEAGHSACVLGSDAFVPALLEACHSVAARLSPQPF